VKLKKKNASRTIFGGIMRENQCDFTYHILKGFYKKRKRKKSSEVKVTHSSKYA